MSTSSKINPYVIINQAMHRASKELLNKPNNNQSKQYLAEYISSELTSSYAEGIIDSIPPILVLDHWEYLDWWKKTYGEEMLIECPAQIDPDLGRLYVEIGVPVIKFNIKVDSKEAEE